MIKKRVTGNGKWGTEFLRVSYPVSHIPNPESGMALIIIMAIVAILSAIGITFMYTMRMEEKAAFNYMNSLKASYLAESGINHAVAILKSDGRDTGFVSYEGSRWGYKYRDLADSVFSAHVDDDNLSVDNDGLPTTVSNDAWVGSSRDSRWIYVDDGDSNIIGRYAVLIIDESSKININTAGDIPAVQGWTPFEINLRDFFYAGSEDELQYWDLPPPYDALETAQELADNIVTYYRYGFEEVAGDYGFDDNADSIILEHDGIDNDADWTIAMDDNGNGRPDPGEYSGNAGCDEPGEGVDDPYEFVHWKPYTYVDGVTNADTPFITIEEIKQVTKIGNNNYLDYKPYLTVYSADENTTDSGLLRLNINLLKDATALYTAMYEAWEDLFPGTYTYNELKQLAAQAAVNTIDYADTDNVSTFMNVYRSDSGRANRDSAGNWLRDTTKSAIWTGDEWIGAKITVISKTTKNRQVRTITGNTITRIDVEPNWDTGDNPLAGSYYYIEDKATARGVEAIRINEIMVKPAYQWNAEDLFNVENPKALPGEELGTTGWYIEDDPDTGIYSETASTVADPKTITVPFEVWRPGSYRVRTLTYATAPEYYTIATIDNNGSPPDEYYLTISDNLWEIDEWESAIVVIASGTGVDQKRRVKSNTANKLIVTEPWNYLPITGDFSLVHDHSFTITFKSNDPDAVFAMGTEVGDIDLEAGTHNIGGWLLEDLGVIKVEKPGEGKIKLETTEWTNSKIAAGTGDIERNKAYLDYIQLSQQPDCEYVELLNISDKEVDISEWTLATSAGFTATIPEGTKIGKGDYLVLAVDKADGMWAGVDEKYIPDSIRHLAEGKDDIYFEGTWPPNLDKVVQLPLIPSPVYISEKGFGDTVILPGSVFLDLPPEPPMKWEENGSYEDYDPSSGLTERNTTLIIKGNPWDNNQWKGATITANIAAIIDGELGDTQITRQIASNIYDGVSSTTITLTTKWVWDDGLTAIGQSPTPNYYIHFDPMSVTLYKGLLADQQIVAQVNYLPQDIENQVAYEQENEVKVYGFVALEKDDPTAVWDRNNDGIDDLWNLNLEEMEPITIGGESIRGGTPAYINSVVDPQNRDIVEDIGIPNLPFATVGDIKDVSLIRVNDYASGFASDGGTDTLEDDDSPWISHEWQNAVIVLVSGKGAGQIRFIDDNTTDEITVTEDWDIIPDATSEYVIFFEWHKVGYDDTGDYIELVKRIADKITVSQKRLEAEKAEYMDFTFCSPPGCYPPDPSAAGYSTYTFWKERLADNTFLTSYYSTDVQNDTGLWIWGIQQRIPPEPGIYELYISGSIEGIADIDTALVKVTTGVDVYERKISFAPDNIAEFGQIEIGGDIPALPAGYPSPYVANEALLQIEIWKDYTANTLYFDSVILTPERRTYGRINIDTADTVVLMSLPGIDQNIAQAIIDYRENPKGYDGNPATEEDNGPFDNIGEILNVQVSGKPAIDLDAFSKISNLITTKSKIFTIISTGQALRESDRADVTYQRPTDPNPKTYEILGEKKYMVVIER